MTIGRRGFALITVLWVVASLSAIVGLGLALTRTGIQTTANRVALARGRWAAEACLAIAAARWASHRMSDTASLDLGRGAHCDWSLEDPSSRVDLNVADAHLLRALGFSETFVRVLLEERRARPLDDIGQVADLPGVDSSRLAFVTVNGGSSLNLNATTPQIMRALPGITPEAIDRILYRRRIRRPVGSLDELAEELSAPARAELLTHSSDLAPVVSFAPTRLLLRAVGWVEGFASRAPIELTVAALPDRLAVLGRRMW